MAAMGFEGCVPKGGVQRGRSPFCREIEGVPQDYHR